MNTYSTEEEQIQAIKAWWKENRWPVLGGAIIGLGAVLGWQGWNNYVTGIGQKASFSFSQMLQSVESANPGAARATAARLIDEYDNTPYGVFAAMLEAKLALKEGDGEGARQRLEWALANAREEGLRHIARVRLARVAFDAGDLDTVAKLLSEVEEGSFAGQYAVLRGDLAVARGDPAAARDAYQKALDAGVASQALVRMKLNDLALSGKPAVNSES